METLVTIRLSKLLEMQRRIRGLRDVYFAVFSEHPQRPTNISSSVDFLVEILATDWLDGD